MMQAMKKIMISMSAFASTTAHREALELSHDEMREVRELCREHNVKFMCTPFDEPSFEFLLSIDTDILKAVSFDLATCFAGQNGGKQTSNCYEDSGGKIAHIKAADIIGKHHNDIARFIVSQNILCSL